jgi:hypothetical protein
MACGLDAVGDIAPSGWWDAETTPDSYDIHKLDHAAAVDGTRSSATYFAAPPRPRNAHGSSDCPGQNAGRGRRRAHARPVNAGADRRGVRARHGAWGAPWTALACTEAARCGHVITLGRRCSMRAPRPFEFRGAPPRPTGFPGTGVRRGGGDRGGARRDDAVHGGRHGRRSVRVPPRAHR